MHKKEVITGKVTEKASKKGSHDGVYSGCGGFFPFSCDFSRSSVK